MRAAVLAACLCVAGCGYVGDPLPPELRIPVKIEDLTGVQRGDQIVVAFTPSLLSTDKTVLKQLRAVELRAGVIPEGEFNLDRWLASSREIPNVPTAPERQELIFSARDFVDRDVLIAVRAIGPSGRPGDWSNFLTLRAVTPPARPEGLTAESAPGGMLLRWIRGDAAEGASWRVFRLDSSEGASVLAARVNEPMWLDPQAAEGRPVAYAVQLVVPAASAEAESPLSDPVRATYEDRFPPSVPSGLTAIAGIATVELTWEPSPEPDTTGYFILRGDGDGPLEVLAGPHPEFTYRDSAIESGKTYRYAVAAVDQRGNRSVPSEPVTISAP